MHTVSFAVTLISREPIDHISKFCLRMVLPMRKGMSKKNIRTGKNQNISTAVVAVPHGNSLAIPENVSFILRWLKWGRRGSFWSLIILTRRIICAIYLNKRHLITRSELIDLATDLNLPKNSDGRISRQMIFKCQCFEGVDMTILRDTINYLNNITKAKKGNQNF